MGAGGSVPFQQEMCVVVVGGGYVGSMLAYKLKKKNFCKVVLIDPKDALFHSIGALRTVVDQSYAPKLFLPYDKMLGDSFLRAKAVGLNLAEKQVVLEDGKTVAFTHLVIASGTTSPFPARPMSIDAGVSAAEGLKFYADYGAQVKQTNRIVLVGGGAVGCELAGEIKMAYPEKEVTIINSRDYLVSPRTSKTFQKKLAKLFADKGITVLSGERVANLADLKVNRFEQGQTVRTESGKEVTSDMVIPCTGSKPNNDFFKETLASSMTEHGALKVDEFLEVKGHEDIFAIGDINDVAEEKMAYTGWRQADRLLANLAAGVKGSRPGPYKTGPFMISVNVGRSGGVGQLPGGFTLPSAAVGKLKGEDLFAKSVWGDYGMTVPSSDK